MVLEMIVSLFICYDYFLKQRFRGGGNGEAVLFSFVPNRKSSSLALR